MVEGIVRVNREAFGDPVSFFERSSVALAYGFTQERGSCLYNEHAPSRALPSGSKRQNRTRARKRKATKRATNHPHRLPRKHAPSHENTRLRHLPLLTYPVLLRVVPREEEGFGRFQKVGRPTLLGGAAAAA